MRIKNKILSLLLILLSMISVGCHKSLEEFLKSDKLVRGTATINSEQYEDAVYAPRWQPFPEGGMILHLPTKLLVHYVDLCPVDTSSSKICYNINFYILLDEDRLELGGKYILEEYKNWDETVVCWDKISTYLSENIHDMLSRGARGVALMYEGNKKTVTTLSGSFAVMKYDSETEAYTVSYLLHKYDKDNNQLYDIKGKFKATLNTWN